ncbi:glycosyltransferase family 2 protein [Paraburkholderia sp. SARCC-3016]|uniref:glycosyltransferase family 2 protein n=1 Tax=Paraburkholderia sp. SARCC-3016 TaxID=3058611 RepID=UPI002807FADF|nr:glycosyltransferase family 2 protein [Paraburkholderia sp. SARCC-3016]MDQ7978075.1 glycosyltransferase family 2 protein [Paraburkholderia sp. SARCC-3016]
MRATNSLAEQADNVDLSIVVPCYNEEEGITELHRRVSDVCKGMNAGSYEIVLVNDGSRDRTWQFMLELQTQDSHIVAINLSRNFGHQLALTAGLQICTGRRVFVIDADLQDPPELLPAMMARMDAGIDVVYGQRIKREGESRFKKTSASAFYRLLDRLVDIDIPVDTGDFRLMSRRAVNALNAMPENHRFIRGMVSWIGLKQEAFPYERSARFAGETKYPLIKMLKFAVDAITGFSTKPLRIATYMGFFAAALSGALMLYVFVAWLLDRSVPGWSSLAIIMLTMGSCQLVVVGILGEYLGRLYIETKGRPLFVIQEIVTTRSVGARAEPAHPSH